MLCTLVLREADGHFLIGHSELSSAILVLIKHPHWVQRFALLNGHVLHIRSRSSFKISGAYRPIAMSLTAFVRLCIVPISSGIFAILARLLIPPPALFNSELFLSCAS